MGQAARGPNEAGEHIVEVRLTRYAVPFVKPYRTARGSASVREGVIVQVKTAFGLTGLGESAPLPDAGEDVSTFVAAVEEAAAWALDRTTTSVSHAGVPPIWRREGSGIEIAAWDALARSRSLSLASFAGVKGEHADSVPVNALVSAESVEEVRTACSAAVRDGYSSVKLKVGMTADPVREIQRIAAAREALGPRVKLRLDANGCWTEDQAFEVLRWAARNDVEYVEQPLPPGNLPAMRKLRSRTGRPIAADEDASSREAIDQIIAEEAADVLILKPLQLGGIGHTLRAAAAAREAGLSVTVTTSIDTGVGTAAALQVACILQSRGYMPGRVNACGLGTLHLLESALVREDLPIVNGTMHLPDGPGLGVDIDPDQLARYTVREWTLAG